MVADTKITGLGSDPRSSSTCLWHARLAEEAETLKDLLSNLHVDKQSEVCVIGLQGYGQTSTILGTCSNSFLDTVIASVNL